MNEAILHSYIFIFPSLIYFKSLALIELFTFFSFFKTLLYFRVAFMLPFGIKHSIVHFPLSKSIIS